MYRSREHKIIAGVCGGIAERFGLPPTIVRLLFIISCIVIPGSQILIYPILWIFIPKRPTENY
jgi:phage shock protein PspC (stress-responsive transcriptional regulator)